MTRTVNPQMKERRKVRSHLNEQIKADSLETTGRLIQILRQILTCIQEERTALFRQEWTVLESVLAKRQDLIQTSTHLIDRFIRNVQQLSNGALADCSLLEGLNWLRENAPADAIDLLLYAGQLAVLATEVRQQTRSLLTSLENRSASSAQAQMYLTRIEAKPVKTALLVADIDGKAN